MANFFHETQNTRLILHSWQFKKSYHWYFIMDTIHRETCFADVHFWDKISFNRSHP